MHHLGSPNEHWDWALQAQGRHGHKFTQEAPDLFSSQMNSKSPFSCSWHESTIPDLGFLSCLVLNGRSLCDLDRCLHDLISAHGQIKSMASTGASGMGNWESACYSTWGCTVLLPPCFCAHSISLFLLRLPVCVHT